MKQTENCFGLNNIPKNDFSVCDGPDADLESIRHGANVDPGLPVVSYC